MNFRNRPRIGRELLDVPMGDMIRQMAFAIAEAQIKLDENSIDVAQMLGGVRRNENEDGSVTFEDSRVFFGKEKTTLQDAIELHNLTNDYELRASIRQALGEANYEATDNLILTSLADLTALSGTPNSANNDLTKIYRTGSTSQTYKYFKFVGLTSGSTPTKIYEEVSEYSYLIKRKGPLGPGSTVNIPQKLSLLELGFTPTFYQFVDTIIEVKISIRYSQEAESNVSITNTQRNASTNLRLGLGRARAGVSVSTTQVNASYSQKYSYSAEGSSLMRTKLVPIPPPAILEDRITRMLDAEFNATPAPTT